jgi:anti-sigma regulatory factor (Ser/Thr protein kinase)
LPPEVATDVELCVTELVTNSVQHADADAGYTGEVRMAVRLLASAVRVEVGDRGQGFDPARAALGRHGDGAGGYGLYIVQMLADRWGVECRDLTWVWFEIDLERAGASR